jgi:hypothetical protein
MRCEENQPTFQALLAKNKKTARTDVGGGTSTVAPSAGESSNDGNKQRDAKYVEYAKYAKIYVQNMQRICK